MYRSDLAIESSERAQDLRAMTEGPGRTWAHGLPARPSFQDVSSGSNSMQVCIMSSHQRTTTLETVESSDSSRASNSDSNLGPSGKHKASGDGTHKPHGIKFNDVRLLEPKNLETQRRHAAAMKDWKQSPDLWDHMSLHRAVSQAESSSQPAAQAQNVKVRSRCLSAHRST
jgi:hypothetical protein